MPYRYILQARRRCRVGKRLFAAGKPAKGEGRAQADACATTECEERALVRQFALVNLYNLRTSDGGLGVRRRARADQLERTGGLHHLPALHLWSGLALPNNSSLQAAEAVASTGAASTQEVPVLERLGQSTDHC